MVTSHVLLRSPSPRALSVSIARLQQERTLQPPRSSCFFTCYCRYPQSVTQDLELIAVWKQLWGFGRCQSIYCRLRDFPISSSQSGNSPLNQRDSFGRCSLAQPCTYRTGSYRLEVLSGLCCPRCRSHSPSVFCSSWGQSPQLCNLLFVLMIC